MRVSSGHTSCGKSFAWGGCLDDWPSLASENERLGTEVATLRGQVKADGAIDIDALFPAFPALLFLFDAEERFVDYRAGLPLFAPAELFLGRRIRDVLPDPARSLLSDALERARSGGSMATVEYSLPTASGARHFEARILPLAAGRTAALCLDVTDRKTAEEAVLAKEERFRQIVEFSIDLLALLDARGLITFASIPLQEALGHRSQDLVGRRVIDFVQPEEAARVESALAQLALEPGGTTRIDFRMRRRDGSVRTVDAVFRNLLHLPAVGAVVAHARDTTDQRRLEQQLVQSQKLESIGRLAGGVAHDFNNLLIGILGYAEFLEQGIRAGKPSLEDLLEIRLAGERARDLTRQLLAVARRQVSAPRVIDPNAVVKESERLLRRLLGEDVQVAVALAPDAWRVRIDPSHLQQIVLNLAVNARDAMPRGGKLTIETSNVDLDDVAVALRPGVRPGLYLLLAVSDTGHGMSPETLAHLFEPFYTTKAAGTGTGLGLATVYGIVAQAGGHVWVYSEPGAGSTFKIHLPRCTEPAVRPTPAPRRPAPRGSEVVLAVEDDPQVREFTLRALREGGYRVLSAADGREALALSRSTPDRIHLLLTDVVMPEASGRELATELSRERPDLRVLFVSGYTQNAIVHHGVLDAGINYLAKPYTATLLLERVREVLDV